MAIPCVVDSLGKISVNVRQIIGKHPCHRFVVRFKIMRIKDDSIEVEGKPTKSRHSSSKFFFAYSQPIKIGTMLV